MPTDPTLTLAQWFSPAFPVGGFHFSHGLEWAITTHRVTDKPTLQNWIEDLLLHGSAHNDALLIAAAFHASPETLPELDATARALAASRERRLEAAEMGTAFARITGDLLGAHFPAFTYPVAIGHAAQRAALPIEPTLQFYLQSVVTNLASVGMRLIPIGQTHGQQIIAALSDCCHRIAADTASGDLDALGASAFMSDIASMNHETLYSRIFRT